jgi:cysteine synthase A
LAFVGAARGYKVTLTMPVTMSIERRRVLRMLGANLELTPGEDGMYAAIDRAERLVAAAPDKRIILHQFKNPANPRIHFETTGPEIWDDTDGAVDVLVCGVGTGGTISGVSQYIKKKKKKKIISVAVEPERSPVIQQTLDGLPIRPGYHAVQGIGAGFIPDTLDLKMIDRVEPVGDDEAIEYAKRLAQEEGLLCGISCGAATAVACRLARQPEFEGKTIVVILPDAGERYLSSPLFDSIS